jgi:N-acetylmuramoyl-L-alanine amidase
MKAKKRTRGTRIGTRPKASKEDTKEIQACLKNAGFYDGKIDGIKGKATRKAIRQFQEANGLTPDGVVGPKTRELLSKHAAAAQGPAAAEKEGAVK